MSINTLHKGDDDDDDDDDDNNNNNNNNSKGNCAVVLVHVTKVYKVDRRVSPLNLSLGARRWYVVNVMPRLLPPPCKEPR